ncbi:MAG: hypothetical protein RJB66_1443 [Pseudomonadota bacterium]|jgi:hypothetical protein
MKTQLLICVATLGLCQMNAMASEQAPSDSRILQFEELREACANPARFQNQVAPSNIQVSCTELKTKWVADPQSSVALPTRRVVVTSVSSNKYKVNPVTAELASEPQAAGCDQYKQVIETLETVQSTTCEQIMAHQGTADEFCAGHIESLKVANPQSVRQEETGKKAGFCNVKMQD